MHPGAASVPQAEGHLPTGHPAPARARHDASRLAPAVWPAARAPLAPWLPALRHRVRPFFLPLLLPGAHALPRDLRCMHCLNTAIESGHDCLDLPIWQVHEKHILLPLLPAALLAPRQPTLFAWFATTAAFSLYPLLERDGQALPYAVCQLGFLALTLALEPAAPPTSPADPEGKAATAAATADMPPPPLRLPWPARAAMGLSLTGMVLLHVLKALVTPPTRYPDIHTVAFAAYSCVHFVAAYVAALGWQWHAIGVEEAHTPFDGRALTPFLLGGAAVHAKSE